MSDGLIRANPVSDEQIQAWADEAERGYDLTKLAPPRPGRPPSGEQPRSRRHEAGASSRLNAQGPRTISRARPLAC